jgi:hypothetical protein
VEILCSYWITDIWELRQELGPITPVLKSAQYVSDEQFSLEKPVAQPQPLMKTGQGQFWTPFKSFQRIHQLLALNG